MKLNLDCIRDILLEAEKCKFNQPLPIAQLEKALPQYYNEDIRYNCLKLYEAGYIDALFVQVDNSVLPCIYEIRDIHFRGHEFLANIRKPENWERTKSIGEKIGSYGLNMAGAIAEGVATAYFQKILNIT